MGLRGPKARSLSARFWPKVHRRGLKDCWEWKASVNSVHGYGQIGYQGSMLRAHRVAWMLVRGPIPKGLCVLHKCDNRKCVNPYHLWLGTLKDNTQDMMRKGRCGLVGDRHWAKKHPEKLPHGDAHWTRRYPKKLSAVIRMRERRRSRGEIYVRANRH